MRFFIIAAILFATANADGQQQQSNYRNLYKYSDNVYEKGITLECDFGMIRHYWGEMYTCIPRNLVVKRYFDYVVNVTGEHMTGKTDADVEAVYILGQKTRFIPYNISKPFNGLRAIRIEGSGLRYLNRTMKYEGKVEYLHLENNLLKEVPSWAFRGFTSLKWLSLRNNQIRYLESSLLREMKSLRRFSVSNNLIEVVPSGMFSYNPELEEIFFYNNDIRMIGGRLTENLPKLKIAAFWGNKCTGVSIYDGSDIQKRLGTEFTTKCGINCAKAEEAAQNVTEQLKKEWEIKRECSSNEYSYRKQQPGYERSGKIAKSSESSEN